MDANATALEAGVLKTEKVVDLTKNLTKAVALPPRDRAHLKQLQTATGRV